MTKNEIEITEYHLIKEGYERVGTIMDKNYIFHVFSNTSVPKCESFRFIKVKDKS
jgi:hypothetical protein